MNKKCIDCEFSRQCVTTKQINSNTCLKDEEIKKVLNKFDKVLESYELDKKFGQLSVDSICHLFPNELITIKNYITNLETCYCNRTDCSGRIKDSEKYDSLQQRIDKAIELVKSLIIFWKKYTPDNSLEIGQLENILNTLGGDKE